MKNIDIDFKSLMIGFLMATCLVLIL